MHSICRIVFLHLTDRASADPTLAPFCAGSLQQSLFFDFQEFVKEFCINVTVEVIDTVHVAK